MRAAVIGLVLSMVLGGLLWSLRKGPEVKPDLPDVTISVTGIQQLDSKPSSHTFGHTQPSPIPGMPGPRKRAARPTPAFSEWKSLKEGPVGR